MTWEELEQCRELRDDRPLVLPLFAHKSVVKVDMDIDDDRVMASWNLRRKRRRELTDGWSDYTRASVRPFDDWKSAEHLKEMLEEQFRLHLPEIVRLERDRRRRAAETEFDSEPEPSCTRAADLRSPRLTDYRTFLASAHARLAPFFAETSRHAMEDIFVDLDLDHTVMRMSGGVPHGDDSAGVEASFGRRERLLLADLMTRSSPSADSAPVRWLVTGDPGAGKSTIARHLARTHAVAGATSPTETPVPVFVSLPRLATKPMHPFRAAEEQMRKGMGDRKATGLEEALHELAGRSGVVQLFLDGFDEVGDEHRDDVVEQIAGLDADLPNVAICVLSRPIGATGLGPTFGRARVRKLSPDRRTELLGRWVGEERATDITGRLATRPALREAVETPLMLALVARLALVSPDLPPTRLALYDAAIDLLLRRGAAFDEATEGVSDPATARRVLETLSLVLQESGAEGWSRSGLDDALHEARDRDPDVDKRLKRNTTWHNHDEFFENVARHGAVLGPHDGDHAPWRYLHRQLREFLAAQAIARAASRETDSVCDRASGMEPDDLGRWAETLGMACGLENDPLETLARLRESSASQAVRVLRDVEGLDPETTIDFLLATDVYDDTKDVWEDGHEVWDGDDLVSALTGFGVGASTDLENVRRALWDRVSDGLDTTRLAFLGYALEASTPSGLDRERFFEACGRPISGRPEIELMPIPSGSTVLGEGTEPVELSAFRMAKYPLTNEQYATFDPRHEWEPWKGVKTKKKLARHPVVNIFWWQAWLFCRWADLELPTEAQWEYACRAGTPMEQDYWSGSDEADLDRVGWYDENSESRTHVVGEKEANPWGLHDVHGNVLEWCGDRCADDAYTTPARPGDGLRNVERASFRVLRGGCWFFTAWACRSAYRFAIRPGIRYRFFGFRPASRRD